MSRIAVLVKGYPRLSETFIAQEIHGLERRGIDQLIVSLRQPYDSLRHDVHDEIRADILYLPEYLKDDPKRVTAARRWAKGQPNYEPLMAVFERDLARDRTVNRWRRLGQALVLAHELPADITWLYTHYLHTPASVARYTAILTGLPFSFSAHAKDIWTTPDWEIREKIADARWGVTCTAINRDHLAARADGPGKVTLVYHGLDFSRFPAPPDRTRRDGPVRLVSVGRAVEKKGYGDLITALKKLPATLDWRFIHIGKGPELARLKARAETAGLASRIDWRGSQSRADVIAALAEADIFVLPSRIARSGDRDGLPNVIMEAQAMGLPVIATRISDLPEVVSDGDTGLLVPERDPTALAQALESLIGDRAQRHRLGAAGERSVKRRFSPEPGLDLLAERFRAVL